MPLSPLDLAGAKDAVDALLAKLDLDAVLFAVEHNDRGWELHVECAAHDGWLDQRVALGDALPAPGDADDELRERVLAALRERLAECKPRA